MASQQGRTRFVNVVPNIKVKKAISEDEDEETVQCRLCNKSFASDVALRNHARMEHMDAYASGDPSVWSVPTEPKIKKEASEEKLIKMKTEQIISSMAPTDLMSLASEDVSYIIIKADKNQTEATTPQQRKRKTEKPEGDKQEKVVRKEKDKEVQPITGPFECLQPSNLVGDGTCHQIFFSCCEYSLHFRDEHTRRRKGLRCQVCEKPLATNGEVPTAPFSCEVCGEGFQFNKLLSEHMATMHVKLKPFECGVCHKRFTQQGGVQQHMRMHTGDRPFPCTFCPKAFTQKSGLDQHLRIHTKVKPYRCVICSKTFSQSVHLRQHMRTHTNVSPFQCGICNKRFKQSSHLNYHLNYHKQDNMTPEQKAEYKKLMAMMNTEKKKNNVVIVLDDEGGAQLAESQDGQLECEEVLLDEHEQMLAEQSIQVVEGDEEEEGQDNGHTYIQVEGDDGDTYILGNVITEMQES